LDPLLGRSGGQGLSDELLEARDASLRERGTATDAAQHFHREFHLVPVQDLGRRASAFGGKRLDISPEEEPKSVNYAFELGGELKIETLRMLVWRIDRRFRSGKQ